MRLSRAIIRSYLFRQIYLRYVDFAIDFACNLSCQHCFATRLRRNGRRKMSEDDYARVARECMKLGALNFSFQGGEPLLVPNLKNIIEACQPDRNLISITTNGTLLTPERVSALKSWGVDILTISLDSAIPEEHDRFRGADNVFVKTMEGIRLALQAGLHVTIGSVVTHQNLRSAGISELIRLAQKLKVLLYFIFPVPAGRWDGNQDILLTSEDLAYIDQKTRESVYVRTDFQANLSGVGCGAAKEILYLTPYGDVLTCPFIHISFGNVFEDTIEEIRQRSLNLKYFSNFHPECLASTDPEFVSTHLSKTFGADRLPLDWKQVFRKRGQPHQ
jgi:MoaA/NifB/PqqE/SkfB family radical SAM enzyme